MNGLIRISTICFTLSLAAPALADEPHVPQITVTGQAHAEVVPDLAIISFSVVTERPTATAAAHDNATAATAVVGEVKAQGIDAKDIRTVSVTLSPVYDDSRDLNGRLIKHTLRGYQARDGFEVRIRALDKTGSMASLFIEKGANNFGGIRFEIEHPETKLQELRGEAAKDALANAEAYANALNLKLGRVTEIDPQRTVGGQQTQFFRFTGGSTFEGAPAPAAVPIEPGVQSLTDSVTITWELAQ